MGRRVKLEKEAISKKVKELLDKVEKRNFTQTVELVLNFQGIDVEDSKYKLNLNVHLPKGRGKDVSIGYFAEGDMNVRAKEISKHVYNKANIDELSKNRRTMRKIAGECYAFIAQADLMAVVGKSWGIVLGPRGKMPQPVPPNADLTQVTERMKNSVRVRTKKSPTIQIPVGTESQGADDLTANIMAILSAIERQITEDNIRSAYVKTTMSDAVRLW